MLRDFVTRFCESLPCRQGGPATFARRAVNGQLGGREAYVPFTKDSTLSASDFFVPAFTLILPSDFFTSRMVTFPFCVAVMRNHGRQTRVKAHLELN